MINLTFDLATGVARLASAVIIKTAADVPVRLVFSAAPGDVSGIQLTLGSDTAAPEALAATEDFAAENSTTWTALLDASDTRLVEFMSGQRATAVLLELMCVIDGQRQIAPNVALTVQASFAGTSGAASSDIDGGTPSSTYSGDDDIDGGTPSSTYSGDDDIDGGTPSSTY